MGSNSTQYEPIPEFDQDESPSTELAVRRDVARAVHEVQGAIIVAQRFPRNEDQARVKLLKSCKRPLFAENAEYEFPRGGNDVAGPSVQLAREAARVWGNIQYGFEITAEDDVWRSIRAYAWDVETNSRSFQEDRFKKLIYRKNKGWIQPDERDLRELTNRRAAIAYRNCILQLIPSDLIAEAIDQAHVTLRDRAAADPDGERKRICDAFSNDLNVLPNTLEMILGHPLAESSPAEIAKLRGIYKSIRDGNSTVADYVQTASGADGQTASRSEAGLNAIKERAANRAAERAQAAEGKQENPPPTPASSPSSTPESQNQERRETMEGSNQQPSAKRSAHRGTQPETHGVAGVFKD